MNPESNSTTVVIDLDASPASPASRPSSVATKDDTSRCHHLYANGRRCSLPGLPSKAGFCLRHFRSRVDAGLPLALPPNDFEDLSADLLPQSSEFDAATSINQFLSRLLILVTKGRVTPRRAAVLAYITNQLLHSHRAIRQEQPVIFEEIGQVEPGSIPRPAR